MIDTVVYGIGLIYLIIICSLVTAAAFYFACNYVFKLMNANAIFFDFVRNLKEFKEWQKNRSKLDLTKLEQKLDEALTKETKESLAKWIDALKYDADKKTSEFLNNYHNNKKV